MAQAAVKSRAVYGAALSKARVQIQKPEISTYRPVEAAPQKLSLGWGWSLLAVLTYIFSFATLYFVFSV